MRATPVQLAYNSIAPTLKTASKVFRFEHNELDLGRYELRRAGIRLPLSRMPMEFLILLLESRGKLVTREEIAAHLWPDSGSVDVVQGINAAVKRIRAVLNDDAAKPRFIETVVGKGYRFIANVEEIEAEPVLPDSPPLLTIVESLPVGVQEQPTSPPSPAARRRWMAVCLLIAGCGAAAWYWKDRSRATVQEPTFRQVTTLISENRATAAAISPDGRWIAYANVDGIFIQAKDGETTALRAPPDFIVDRLAWLASDAKLVASGFSSLTYVPAVWTVSVTGATPSLLRIRAREGVPSPDGTRIAFITDDRSAIWMMGASGEDARRVIAGSPQDTFPLVFWSPDGRRLAFQRRHYAPERRGPNLSEPNAAFEFYYEHSYRSVDLATGRMTANTPEMWMNSASALPDGRLLFLRRYPPDSDPAQLWEVRTNPATGAFLDAPRKIAIPADRSERVLMKGISATADGKQILVLRDFNYNAVFVGDFSASPPRIGNIRRLTFDNQANYPHAWTPDSREVIFESNRRNGNYDLYKQNVDRRTPQPIVTTRLTEILPQLGPDGRWVLYSARVAGGEHSGAKLMRVPVDGGTPEEVPIGGPLDEFRCALGRGKRCVLRTTVQHQYYAFYELDPIRGRGRELARTPWTPQVLGDWDISPDGAEVAIPNHDSRDARIRVVSLESGPNHPNEREITLPGLADLRGVVWAADGRAWFVSVDTTVGNRLLYVWPDGRFQSLGDISGWAVPSPDGRRMAFLNRIITVNAWMLERR